MSLFQYPATADVASEWRSNEHPILGQVVLGYSPMIDRERAVTRDAADGVPGCGPTLPLDAGALLQALAEVWPGRAARSSLNVASESLLHDLLRGRAERRT